MNMNGKNYSIDGAGRIKLGCKVVTTVATVEEFKKFQEENNSYSWNESSVAKWMSFKNREAETDAFYEANPLMVRKYEVELRQVLKVKMACYAEMLANRTSLTDAIEGNNFDCSLTKEQIADYNMAQCLFAELEKYTRSNSNTALWSSELLDALANPQSVAGVIH